MVYFPCVVLCSFFRPRRKSGVSSATYTVTKLGPTLFSRQVFWSYFNSGLKDQRTVAGLFC